MSQPMSLRWTKAGLASGPTHRVLPLHHRESSHRSDRVTCVHFGTNLQGAVVSGCLRSSCPPLGQLLVLGPCQVPCRDGSHWPKGVGL